MLDFAPHAGSNPRSTWLVSVLLLLSTIIAIAPAKGRAANRQPSPKPPEHALFTAVLQTHVRDGRVDYAAIARDARFSAYLEALQATDPQALPENHRLAFWLNAYNAFTIKRVIDQYPTKSLMNKFAYLLRQSDFHKKFIVIHGHKYSLNDIEHRIIRPMRDPRIHFALVCAARSCPLLRNEAYVPERLDAQLDDQARVFITDTTKNRFDFQNNEAYLSAIFDWFAEDFEKTGRSVLEFVARYLPSDDAAALQQRHQSFKIRYLPYDWRLNDFGESPAER